MRAGHCTGCDRCLWRSIALPDGRVKLLWPEPGAMFAVIPHPSEHPGGAEIRGVAYCAACAPPIGAPAPEAVYIQVPDATIITRYQSAQERHGECFTPSYRAFLAAWIPEETKADPAAWLAAWDADHAMLATMSEAADG